MSRGALLEQLFRPALQERLQRRARARLRQQLSALEVGAARDHVRHRIVDAHLRRHRHQLGRLAQERERRGEGPGLGAQHRLGDERREARRFALGELRGGEAGIVVAFQRGEQRMLRVAGLDQHLARALAPPGASRDLFQRGEQPLGGPVIGRQQGVVGVEHPDQRQSGEIVPLGEQLGADQDVGLAAAHALERARRARRAGARCRGRRAPGARRETSRAGFPRRAGCRAPSGAGRRCRRSDRRAGSALRRRNGDSAAAGRRYAAPCARCSGRSPRPSRRLRSRAPARSRGD